MKKNILNIIFALIIVVVGPNVYADGTKGKKDKETRKQKAEKVVERISNKLDTELNLENWMSEITAFTTNESFVEEELYLENWMTESFVIENELVLEGWMTEVFEIEETEAELELEEWMLEPFTETETFQEEELLLENWMLTKF
jgi:hypothetical protein